MSECPLFKKEKKEVFKFFHANLIESITTWDYFVNWQKVLANRKEIEIELHLLNSLIGEKENFKDKAKRLFLKYPETINAIPYLLAIRKKSLKVLIDTNNLIQKEFNFKNKNLSEKEAENIVEFLEQSGLADLFKKGIIKNIPDYYTGVEVGLDTNARKNRTGKLMEKIVETFVAESCLKNNAKYITQATKKAIKKEWGIEIKIDRSERKIDFAILTNKKNLIFIETNFYGGGGSKLKSTAGEYITMSKFWQKQGIEFVWITDGKGWLQTLKPLEEFFEQNTNLLNLNMLKSGCLNEIIKRIDK